MTLRPDKIPQLRKQLLRWYDRERRDLPWRHTTDPYKILVSEIMLQQTRVSVVIDRYRAFVKKFPTLRSLARAEEHQVLALWSGLGYYRRARSLHQTAGIVAGQHAGRLPGSADELRSLPGIGRYTAAAVASIAFHKPVAVVDGNVERVLRRLFGNQKADPWQQAQTLLDPTRPGDFNQSMMELGATVCSPVHPACSRCPLAALCKSAGRADSSRIARAKPLLKHSYRLWCVAAGSVFLVRRSRASRQMPGLWELPAVPAGAKEITKHSPLLRLRHSITTTRYSVAVFEGKKPSTRLRGFKKSELSALPLTGLTVKVLRKQGWLN